MRSRALRKLRRPLQRGPARAVVDETAALYHRLRWVAEQIYGEEGRSTARRGILRGLTRYGPQTVPQLARTRAVTRQHVQEVIDSLVADGLVELRANPAHARSRLARATPRGRALVERMDAVDARVLAAATAHLAAGELEMTARTLRAIRESFELGARWRRVLR